MRPTLPPLCTVEGLPRLAPATAPPTAPAASLGAEQLTLLLAAEENTISGLEQYVDDLLAKIVEHCPKLLETSEVLAM